MRPRGLAVHECLAGGPVLVADLKVLHHFGHCSDRHFLYVLDEDSLLRRFSELQLPLLVDVQQVSELFVVELDVRAHDQKILGLVRLGRLEDRLEAARDDAFLLLVLEAAHHGVGLARAGLAIGEDRAIVALEYFLGEVLAGGVEDVGLRGGGLEDVVEGEGFGVFSLGIYVSHS